MAKFYTFTKDNSDKKPKSRNTKLHEQNENLIQLFKDKEVKRKNLYKYVAALILLEHFILLYLLLK